MYGFKVSEALLEAGVVIQSVFCLLRQASCSYNYVVYQSNWGARNVILIDTLVLSELVIKAHVSSSRHA